MVSQGDGSYPAFALDRAVWLFGTQAELAMENAGEARGKKAKPEDIKAARLKALQIILSSDGESIAPLPGTFRDPAGLVRR